MEKLVPQKIKVKGDVYELVREVAQPSKDMQMAIGLLQELSPLQEDFKLKVQATIELLGSATSDAFVTIGSRKAPDFSRGDERRSLLTADPRITRIEVVRVL